MPLDSASLRLGYACGVALRAPFGRLMGSSRISQIIFSILAFLAIPSASVASPRTWQPLIIQGSQAPQLCKRPLNQFEVLAMRDGKLAAIPFQIDQVNADGNYVLPEGPQPIAPQHPGVLDAKDEIVMMIADLGERAKPEATLPPGL